MQKIILLLSIALATITNSFGQSLSPNESTEFCPLVNTTFTVTIPLIKSGTGITLTPIGTPTIVTGVTGTTSSGGNTTFTFVGRFSDDNNTQSFKVDYTRNSTNNGDFAIFNFKKIKSLKFFSQPSAINTNLAEIVSAPCQITTHNLNFINIRFGNGFDGTVSSYGNLITQYEYLLPTGWKLGSTTSTGSWIVASSSVIITSNLATGDGGSIQIRALNTDCGISLSKSPIKSIPIRRPKPTLTFTGASTICSSTTFQATGVPSWVDNTLWSVSPSSLVSISSPTSNPTIFTTVGNGTGTVNFTINGGASCPLSFNYNTQEIVNKSQIEAGAPVTTWPEVFYPTTNCLPMGFNVTYTTTSQFQPYDYEWGYYEGPSGNGNPYVLVGNGGTQQAIRITNSETINRISVKAINACGAGVPNIREFTFSTGCDAGGDVEYKIKPKVEKIELKNNKFEIVGNPVSTLLALKIPLNNLKKQIQISDLNGKVLITKANTTTSLEKVDISKLKSGVYFVTLWTENKKQVLKFVKQ